MIMPLLPVSTGLRAPITSSATGSRTGGKTGVREKSRALHKNIRRINPAELRFGGSSAPLFATAPLLALTGQSLMREAVSSMGLIGSPPTSATGLANTSYGWLAWAKALYPFARFENWKNWNSPLDSRFEAGATNPDLRFPEHKELFYGGQHARGGQWTATARANMDLFLALQPDLTILNIGESEIETDTPAVLLGKLQTLVNDMLNGSTARVIVVVPFTRSRHGSGTGWTPGNATFDGYRQKLADLAVELQNTYAGHPRVSVFDPHPIHTGGTPLNEPLPFRARDHVHLTARGAYHVGKAFAQFLRDLRVPDFTNELYPDITLYNASTAPFGNLLPNPVFAGNGGTAGTGASGLVPDFCSIIRTAGNASVVSGVETGTDGLPQWRLEFTPDNGAESSFDLSFMGTASANGAEMTNPYTVGQWVHAYARLSCSAYSDWRETRLFARPSVAPYDLFGGRNTRYPSTRVSFPYEPSETLANRLTHMPEEAWSGYIDSPAHQLEGVGGFLRLRVQVTIGTAAPGGAGNPVLRIARPCLQAMPDPRVMYNL
jgi:hypothetical protein